MNTYNDNLHSSVVNSLNNQEQEIQNIQAVLDASIYTLYYAQGAKITDEEQLGQAQEDYKLRARIKKQAVDCHCLSANVNATALDQKKYTSASVANTATAASDVQIATNAIVRLASNVGSIFSIVSAADFGTDIYVQSKNAYEKMNRTAYKAEVASKLSMEASYLTAEVPYNTVAGQAKGTNDAVTSLLATASKDLDSITDTVAAKNDDLAKASDAEKAAEGDVLNLNTDYNSTKKAYLVNNAELNLALQVPSKYLTNHSFRVTFDNYVSPFHNIIKREKDGNLTSDKMSFPVDFYYIFLVKNSNQPVFSIAEAEGLVAASESKRYVKIPAKAIRSLPDSKFTDPEDLFIPEKISVDIEMNTLLDADGDPMIPGKEYVVFVLAVFDPIYQKAINNFAEYLTAASERFALTNLLASPQHQNIWSFPSENDKKTNPLLSIPEYIVFGLVQNPAYNVQYRCIFLPDNTDLIKSLLTENHLNKVQDEVQDYDYLLENYISKIDELNEDIATAGDDIKALDEEINKAKDDKKKKELEHEKEELVKLTRAKESERNRLQIEMQKFMESIFSVAKTTPGFFFNLKLAEKILVPNYTDASTISITIPLKEPDNKKWDKFHHEYEKKDARFKKKYGANPPESFRNDLYRFISDVSKRPGESEEERNKREVTITLGYVAVEPGTSDNFGNLLIRGKKYLPAILSYSTDEEKIDFTNSLSDFSQTEFFTYNG